MNYIYHLVPNTMEGSTFYPLNILKNKFPEIYTKEAAKYEHRKHVMDLRIPAFDCLWNDVLHFSAVPPIELKRALVEAGMDESIPFSFYQIDPTSLDKKNLIVYLNHKREKSDETSEKDFTPFDQEEIAKYSLIPQIAKDRYKEAYSAGKKPLLFLFVPHILYYGEVDISNAPIITV